MHPPLSLCAPSQSHPCCHCVCSYACSYLPAATWQLELFLALFSTALLLSQLLHLLPPISQTHYIPYFTIPLSTLLLLDSYLTLTQLETLYASRTTPGSALLDGYTLNARRFREQRDCYLALYTLVIGVVLLLIDRQLNELHALKTQKYRMQTKLDRLEERKAD